MGVHAMKLCFGVVDQPYDYGDEPGKPRSTWPVTSRRDTKFLRTSGKCIRTRLSRRQVLNWRTSWSITLSIRLRYQASIFWKDREDFPYFLETEEMAGMTINGNPVPTQAALLGVNSRLKDKYTESDVRHS